MEIQWNWAAEIRNKGSEGFNNAGILTFNSHVINSFVREMFQNSNDAKKPTEEKVKIKIEYKKIKKKSIPAYSQFEEILGLIKESNSEHVRFFTRAENSLSKNEIDFLIYSDSNTIGLSGSDEDKKSSFSVCVLSEGISAKESKTAGGSFGIGKNAIFGISNLRTVLYSSLNNKGEFIFQGVSKLASYRKQNCSYEGKVYLGNGTERSSIRNPNGIPDLFRRTEPGLSQFVMGVDLDANWVDDFIQAILRNYWLLLTEDGLEVEIINNGHIVQKINKSNVIELIKEHFTNNTDQYSLQPYGNPFDFADALLNGEKIEFDIPHIGKCSFHYKEIPNGENNIAYMRNGMVVFTKIERRLVGANVAGVFKCETPSGNIILRQMEPPKHDNFEPQMLADYHESLSKSDGEKICSSIKDQIRNEIKTLIDKYKQEIETPPFISELFEDLQKSIESTARGERKNEKSELETLPRTAANEKISVILRSGAENTSVSQKEGNAIDLGSGKAEGAAKGESSNGGRGKGKGESGGTSKKGKTLRKSITSRVFYHSSVDGRNIHKGIIRSDHEITNAELSFSQYADSGSEIAFDLHSIKDSEGKSIPFNGLKDSDGLIIDYTFLVHNINSDEQYFFFEVSENQKSAFILNG